jgi:glycosyltransferase involved in cell wall biosynthesis
VNLEKFEFCEVPQGPQCFILIGRLLKAKGIAEYVKAASVLKLEGVNARFLLLGPLDRGPDAIPVADLTEWVDANKIEYLGEVQDVRPIIRDCTVMVLPSYREGVPRSVLEAMAMGRAIITTDAPGCRETVVNGVNGFLVNPYSSDELVTAMRLFISEKELASAMGKNSHIIVSEKFDVKKVNEIMLKIMRI